MKQMRVLLVLLVAFSMILTACQPAVEETTSEEALPQKKHAAG